MVLSSKKPFCLYCNECSLLNCLERMVFLSAYVHICLASGFSFSHIWITLMAFLIHFCTISTNRLLMQLFGEFYCTSNDTNHFSACSQTLRISIQHWSTTWENNILAYFTANCAAPSSQMGLNSTFSSLYGCLVRLKICWFYCQLFSIVCKLVSLPTNRIAKNGNV